MPATGHGMGYSAKPVELTTDELYLANQIIFGLGEFWRSTLSDALANKVKGPRSGLFPHHFRYNTPCEKLLSALVRKGVVKQVSGTDMQIYNGTGYIIKGELPVFTMTMEGRAAFLKRKNDERFASINRA